MEKKILQIKLKDNIPHRDIRKQTNFEDVLKHIGKQKLRWAGPRHVGRMHDNRWTKRCTEWQPRERRGNRGRPARRWRDDNYRGHGWKDMDEKDERQRGVAMLIGGLCSV